MKRLLLAIGFLVAAFGLGWVWPHLPGNASAFALGGAMGLAVGAAVGICVALPPPPRF